MRIRLYTFILFFLFAVCFSACSKAESQSNEVVIDIGTGASKDEVIITNADIKKEIETVSSVKTGSGLQKRTLADKSYIETIIDGFGNRIETRHFPETSIVSMIILRSSAAGGTEVTVYGAKGDTKIVAALGENAMTASADEIASLANLSSETKFTTSHPNFMKGQQNQSQSSSLQPLPSSSFQQPNQPVQNAQPENVTGGETTNTQPAAPEEEEED